MAWKDRLIDASFKNIQFKINNSDYESGRRTQVHNFANRDKGYVQDLGQETDTFSVEAYIVQNIENDFDYFSARDSLIKVLKSAGSGTLFHPFLGIKKVQVTTFSVNETFDEGGIARFTIEFKEAGERALPISLSDFFSLVDNAVNQAMDLVGDAFYTAYSAVSLFQDTVSNVINRSMGMVKDTLSSISGIATKIISESTSNVNSIQNMVSDILDAPNDIFNSLKNVCYSLAVSCGMGSVLISESQSTKGTTSGNSVALQDKAEDIFLKKITISTNITGGETGSYSGVTRGNVTELDPNNIDETLGKSVINNIIDQINNYDMSGMGAIPENQEKNITLIIETFKFQMIAILCRIAIRVNFFDQEEALEYMQNISDIIDTVLLDMGATSADGTSAIGVGKGTEQVNNKDIFLSLQNIKKIFIDNMLKKASLISKAIDFIVSTDIQTTLQLAYEKYEDLDRSIEIFNKNKSIIQHPGFLPCGETIRILNA